MHGADAEDGRLVRFIKARTKVLFFRGFCFPRVRIDFLFASPSVTEAPNAFTTSSMSV